LRQRGGAARSADSMAIFAALVFLAVALAMTPTTVPMPPMTSRKVTVWSQPPRSPGCCGARPLFGCGMIEMAEIEIGIGKSGRRAYGFDDIAIVPSRRTRDPEDVDISWEIDAYRFELPLLAAAMDGVVSPATAIEIGRLGGVGVLNLEGLWTRYEDPSRCSRRSPSSTTRRPPAHAGDLRRARSSRPGRRAHPPDPRGRVVAVASVTPQRRALCPPSLEAELDLLVIQGTVVSAEHVSKNREPLNLKRSSASSTSR
jgi:hypothetical protein